MTLYALARLLHLVSMSVWMGAGLLAPADVASSLTGEPEKTRALLARLRRTAQLMNFSAYATVLTGFALIFLGPGLTYTPLRIWWGLGLTILAIALGKLVIRPAISGMVEGLTEPLPAEKARHLSRLFALGVHGESAIRLIVLVLMLR